MLSEHLWLGTHKPGWLGTIAVPLFVSRRQLCDRKSLPVAQGMWALDSGGFTELALHGKYRTSPADYAAEIDRYRREIGGMAWAAPQDWMCEPFMVEKTGLTVEEHQRRTVRSFLEMRDRAGPIVIPVLQGWRLDDYHRCWDMYERAGARLEDEPVVGLGSVCRRQSTSEAGLIARAVPVIYLSDPDVTVHQGDAGGAASGSS